MKLTKEEAIKRHRELWGWLAENPTKNKQGWPGWKKYGRIRNDCFCCELAITCGGVACALCPFEWPKTSYGYTLGCTPCEESYYGKWKDATAPEGRSKYAALIRDLPEKKDQPAPKFKVGDKVVPVSEPRLWISLDEYKECGSFIADFLKENEFLFIIRLYEETAVLSDSPTSHYGDTFNVADLRPYIEPKYHAAENYSCCEIVVNQYDRKTIYNGPATICIINLEGKDYKGIAKCAPDDTFNERFGQMLAEVRAFKAAFEDAERMLLGR